ncbi:MAG: hypothetical protein LC679_08240, partial [Intrasporangiaceae bacterium]|nr:hypothetical protein [Intrasporangiaceae bacterium]
MPVVVDPNGRCPEGHDLGPAGERIEKSLGRAEPHPDEPQPWIAILDADEVMPEHETSAPRAARPISIGPELSDAELNASSADGLLQELHALHGADGDTPGERAGGLSIAPSSTPEDPPTEPVTTTPADQDPSSAATRSKPDAPTPGTPASPAASAPWDDWDDLGDRSTEEASDTDADHAPDTEPTPTPRGAPTVRSQQSMSAMAELAALLGDDGPAPAPSSPATTDPTSAPTPLSSP